MSRHRKCVICGLKEKDTTEKPFFAKFPLNEDRCKEWVKLVGNEDLLYLPIEKLHDLRHVCGRHFEKKDFTKTGNRLKKRAIPKIGLTLPPLPDNMLESFPLHITSKRIELTPPISMPIDSSKVALQSTEQPTPSTSYQCMQENKENITNADPGSFVPGPGARKRILATSNLQNVRSTSLEDSQHENVAEVSSAKKKKLSQPEGTKIITPFYHDHSYCLPVGTTEHGPQPIYIPTPTTSRQRASPPRSNWSEKELQLYNQLKEARTTISSIKKSVNLINNIETPFFQEIANLAVKNQKRKPKGRRWTTQNKISLLAIFKRSPKAYKYLRHLMPLPSIKTLQNLLKKIPLRPGLCKPVIQYLKNNTPKNAGDKYCCLLFDEIAIKPRLIYNIATDEVEGFVDMGGSERNGELADHALVFMLQGLRKKYKQPIAFYFVKGTISSQKLAQLVKEILVAVNETGYQAMATVCDQGPTNMGAYKILRGSILNDDTESTKNYFEVNNKKIYMVYDVPHLFKSIRNNFMNYGEIIVEGKKGKWSHLVKVEEQNRNLLYLSKISENHVRPKYRAKMKVKYAAQILSNTVSAVLKLLALAENNPHQSDEIMQTGDIIHDLDKLFDCTNGPSGPDDIKKGQRQNVSVKSNHLETWASFRKKLKTVKFNRTGTGIQAKNVRCIEGYMITLRSFRDLWTDLQSLGFKYLNLRQLNQDALENLFGVLRQHSPTNKHPTVSSFIGALKSSVISKMTSPHSRGSNCLNDTNILLTDFHDLVFEEDNEIKEIEETVEKKMNVEDFDNVPVISIPDIDMEMEEQTDFSTVENQSIVYVSGYLARCILKTHKCDSCIESLTTKPDSGHLHTYIQLREWCKDKVSLTYPTENLCRFVDINIKTFETDILLNLYKTNIRQLTVTSFMANSDDLFITCEEHRGIIINSIFHNLALLLIRRQCDRVNKNISIKEENVADAVKKAQQQGVGK